MKKSTLVFILVLIALFCTLHLLLNKSNNTEEIKNTGIRIVSEPVSVNIKKEDYVSNFSGASSVSVANINAQNSSSDFSVSAEEAGDYSYYVGNWIYGEDLETVKDVKKHGGIILAITSYDEDKQVIEGEVVSVQEPPQKRIAKIEFQSEIKDGVVYFKFDNDEYGNSGNGIITLNNGVVRISISTGTNEEDPSAWSLGNGLFTLKKSK